MLDIRGPQLFPQESTQSKASGGGVSPRKTVAANISPRKRSIILSPTGSKSSQKSSRNISPDLNKKDSSEDKRKSNMMMKAFSSTGTSLFKKVSENVVGNMADKMLNLASSP